MGAWCDEVVERFAPLLSAFEFSPTYEDEESVRFEKPGLFVEVTFNARRAGEVNLWIGMIHDLEPPFELADIVRASDCPPEMVERVQLMQASDPEVVGRLLDWAFEVLDACARDFLLGNADAFARAKAIRSARARENMIRANASADVAAADLAWQRKDYRTVHALLDPVREALDATHRRRLDFSARRLQQD